jgi:cell division protein FtsL
MEKTSLILCLILFSNIVLYRDFTILEAKYYVDRNESIDIQIKNDMELSVWKSGYTFNILLDTLFYVVAAYYILIKRQRFPSILVFLFFASLFSNISFIYMVHKQNQFLQSYSHNNEDIIKTLELKIENLEIEFDAAIELSNLKSIRQFVQQHYQMDRPFSYALNHMGEDELKLLKNNNRNALYILVSIIVFVGIICFLIANICRP